MNESVIKVPAASQARSQAPAGTADEAVTAADYFAGKRCPECGSRHVMILSVEAQGSVELGVFAGCDGCGLREEV